jgi:glycosyltransferase involved in cell wall biosynthesis
MSKLSFNIIVKDEEENLKRLLPLVKPYFDELVVVDTGSQDKSKEVAYEQGAIVVNFPWIDDFSAARNAALKHSKGDWVFWLDADDDVEGLEGLKGLIEAAPQSLGAYFMTYEYTIKDGRGITPQKRERLFRREWFQWEGRCHETAIPLKNCDKAFSNTIKVYHRATLEEREQSLERNLRILLKEYEENKDKTDPRTLYYLGNTFIGRGEYRKAGEFFTKYLEVGGWDEERFDSWWKMAECLRHQGEHNAAIYAGMEAAKLLPFRPEPYLVMGRVYKSWGDATGEESYFRKAIEWIETGMNKSIPETSRVVNMEMLTWIPLTELAACHLQLGDAEKARNYLEKAYRLSNDQAVLKDLIQVEDLYLGDKAIRDLLSFAQYLSDKEPDTLPKLVEAIPKELAIDARLIQLRNQYAAARAWGEREIAIFCGKAYEDWADPSALTGIGGSEEAVIYLSRELVKLGYKVTVFNSCGALAGVYKGVEYKPYYEFNPRDSFNILISWRMPGFFRNEFTAKQKYLWLHDVPSSDVVEIQDRVDKIIVLSEYHRSLLPDIPDEKFFITNNGIDPTQFKEVEKEPNTLFWGSSYDRGLQVMLEKIMPLVVKEVPDAKIHVAYGWNTFLKMRSNDPQAMSWKAYMDHLLAQSFVVHHDRLSHKKLAELMGKCQVWAYPTEFTEINCITLQKVQAAGCYPIVSNVGALPERVVSGEILPYTQIYKKEKAQKEFAKAIVKALKQKPQVDTARAKDDFSWSVTAKEWNELFSKEVCSIS